MSWLIPEGAQVDWQAWATFGAGLANVAAIIFVALWGERKITSALSERMDIKKAELSIRALKNYRAILREIYINPTKLSKRGDSIDEKMANYALDTLQAIQEKIEEHKDIQSEIEILIGSKPLYYYNTIYTETENIKLNATILLDHINWERISTGSSKRYYSECINELRASLMNYDKKIYFNNCYKELTKLLKANISD